MLNAAYFLWAFQRVFFGKLNEKYTGLVDINQRELFTVVPLLVITIFLGIYPSPFLDMTKETRKAWIEKVAIVVGISGIF